MEFLTGKQMQRRTFLRGMGASVALPLMDAMVPAGRLRGSSVDEKVPWRRSSNRADESRPAPPPLRCVRCCSC